jgi:hypothetical protein
LIGFGDVDSCCTSVGKTTRGLDLSLSVVHRGPCGLAAAPRATPIPKACAPIYDGQDVPFGSVSQQDRKIVADHMQMEFPDILKDRCTMVALAEAACPAAASDTNWY